MPSNSGTATEGVRLTMAEIEALSKRALKVSRKRARILVDAHAVLDLIFLAVGKETYHKRFPTREWSWWPDALELQARLLREYGYSDSEIVKEGE